MTAHILIVEDTPHNLQLMTYLLEARGHRVEAAETGVAGLEAVAASRPDLVLMDLHLPDMGGEDVLARLRADPATRDLTTIAVTAFAMVGDRERVLAAGFDDYMTKPLDPTTFARDVERHLTAAESGSSPSRPPEPELPLAEPAALPSGPLVLVVDDSATNVNLMRSILEPSGYRLCSATTSAEAVAVASQLRPDLILSDLHLGEESGFDLLLQLHEDSELAAIPFAFVSSSAKPYSPEARQAAEVAYFISRPMEPQAMLDVIAGLLPSGSP